MLRAARGAILVLSSAPTYEVTVQTPAYKQEVRPGARIVTADSPSLGQITAPARAPRQIPLAVRYFF